MATFPWSLGLMTTSVAFLHTLLGPDHYLPFIAMGQSARWSGLKTIAIAVLRGLGHILSSVVLGVAGIALGVAMFRQQHIESFRGDLAAWMMMDRIRISPRGCSLPSSCSAPASR